MLQDTNVPDSLQPIIQAAQLLQARKTDEDVQSVCDMCDKLSMFQVSDLCVFVCVCVCVCIQ
jgi:myosin-5